MDRPVNQTGQRCKCMERAEGLTFDEMRGFCFYFVVVVFCGLEWKVGLTESQRTLHVSSKPHLPVSKRKNYWKEGWNVKNTNHPTAHCCTASWLLWHLLSFQKSLQLCPTTWRTCRSELLPSSSVQIRQTTPATTRTADAKCRSAMSTR